MEKSYQDVQSEFEQFKAKHPDDPSDLTSFAKGMDELDGVPVRAAAYTNPWYKQLNALVDTGFEKTGLPQLGSDVGGAVGAGVDSLADTHIAPVLQGIGRDTPRMIAESLLTVPEAASGVGAPAAIATWLNNARKVGKIVGYGDAALKGGAQTDSVLGAAMGAGQMYGANKLLLPKEMGGLDIGGTAKRAVTNLLDNGVADTTNAAQKVLGPLVGFGTDVAGVTALNEATRQGMMSVGPNAVGLTDPARNPLTEENIAGNVAGAAFFAPQLYHGLKNPQRLQPRVVDEIAQNIEARNNAEQAAIDTHKIIDPTQVQGELPGLDPGARSRQEAIYGIIKTNLDAASVFDRDGNTVDADRARQNALSAINEAAQGRYSPFPPEVVDKIKTTVDNEARMSTDNRPEWLSKFSDEVKGIIDTLNEGRVNMEEESAQRRETMSPKDFAKWETDQKKNIGESWHPGARDPSVVDRVWASGKLQPLTPEWLQSEFNATVDAGGNPQFASRVVAQKVANYMADRLPGAVEADVASRKAVTEQSKGVQQLSQLDRQFADALNSLPPQIREAVIHRTVEIQRNSNFTQSEAERMGVSEGTRIDKRSGRPVTPYPNWQKAVVQAAASFDPEARTILLKRGKEFLKVPYTRLVEKSPQGKYLWEPPETHVPVAAGGKSTAGNAVEQNIESLATKGEQENVGALDEEEFKAALAEGVTGEFLHRTGGEALTPSEDTVPYDVKLGLKAGESSPDEQAVTRKIAQKAETIKKNMASLSDQQLWSLARDEFRIKNSVQEQAKVSGLRPALEQILGGKFHEARVYFQFKNPVEGQRAGRTIGEGSHVDRAAKVLAKLADPKAVERARGTVKAQEGASDWQQYQDVQQQIKEKLAKGDLESPEMTALWQKNEDIKNRNGGMPPQPDAKPQTEGASDSSPGTLVNQPPAGQFEQDAVRTVKARITQLLGRAGYSGTARDFLTEIATALVRNAPDKNTDFYRLVGHEEGMMTPGLPQTNDRFGLALNVDKAIAPGDERRAAVNLLQTLQHEIMHMDGYIKDGILAKPDAYSDERKRTYDNMMYLATNMNPDERASMLQQIREYVPKEMQSKLRDADSRPYGTQNPEETVSEITGHVINMLFFDTERGRAAAKEMLDYAPQEFREFARNTFMTVHDIMQAMKDAVEIPDIRADAGKTPALMGQADPFILTHGFDAMIDAARTMTELRHVDAALADARGFIAQADGFPNPQMTNAMLFTKDKTKFKSQQSMPAETSPEAMDAFKMAADWIGPRALDKASRPNIVMRTLAPFRNLMWAMEKDGNQMARPVADAIFSLEGGSNRLQSRILGDFMKRGPDGTMKYDQDNPLIQRIQKEPTGPWRDNGLNKVRAWQQEEHEVTGPDGKTSKRDAQQMFVQDPKTGAVMVNPAVKGAQEAWDGIKSQLSKADQDLVMNASVTFDKVGQRSKDVIMAQLAESNVNKAAVLIMATNRDMPTEQALGLANAAHEAFLSGNVMSLGGTIPPQTFEMLKGLFTGADGKSGLIGNLIKVGEHFDSRPGYSSEQLPHDWIVRYRNAKGDVKFDSRPTEKQAILLGRQLTEAGNRLDGEIVNRRDANSLTKVDDPSNVLTKISEQENFVWDKFVQEVELKYGTVLGQALRDGYTPLARAIDQQATQGVGKFLAPRKGFVDRTRFDYLDATLASAQRLAYSVAVKSMKERVDLLLNDPSVRLKNSFREVVNGHVQEMLRSQSETLKEMKGIVSGYYIGANLGSAVTNALQSLQTLVPILDAKNPNGSWVKPWKQLSVAVKDATDMTLSKDWQKVAEQAKRKDPATWSEEETVAALWARANESGGFSHTVVDDLVYGTDQRLLANAKFGRGDYGPVTKASMVRSGMYLLNQFAMKPFRWVEHGNAKVSFLAGVRQAYEQGLRGDAAFSHANQVQGLATFGGGRANSTGLQTALSRGFTPGGAGLALALQQYGFGVVAMHAQFVKDAIGKSDMTASEKFHARRVYGSMLMTQVALAGTLGLPLVGAILTSLEKVFGIPANQAVRNGLAQLSTGPDGEPDETGQTIAEIGLNGFGNYYTGLDVSSRLGTSSLLGTSSYRGFNWGDLMGPAAGILENGVKSLGYFGQGEPLRAASTLAPQALKNAILQTDMQHKYGDSGFRDAAGNLMYTPTPTESTLYNFGVRPARMSQRRQLQSALQTSNDIAVSAQDRELDKAAESLTRGDATQARRMAMERQAADPTQRYQDVLRQVMDRAVGSQVEKDLLATGSRLNEADRKHIVRTFGADVNQRRSEVELQKLRMQMAATLGDPSVMPNVDSFKQAAMVDALVQGGKTRSEAVRLVQFLGL